MNVVDYEYERTDILFKMWGLANIGVFFMIIGAFISNTLFNPKGLKLDFEEVKYSSRNINGFSVYIAILFFIGVAALTLLKYRNSLGALPIEYLIFGNSDSKLFALLRSDATGGFVGKYYRYRLLMEYLPTFTLVITFFLKSNGIKWRFLFSVNLLFVIFISVRDFQKSPIVELVILLTICQILLKNRINKKLIFGVISMLSVIIVLMYMYFMGLYDRDSSTIAGSALNRIFIAQASPLYHYFLYWEESGYLLGRSFPNPAGILPFENIRLTKEIARFMWGPVKDAVGSAPTVFYGDWLLNFGYSGAFFSMVTLGFILQTFDNIFMRILKNKTNVFALALYVFLMIYFGRYAGTTFITLPLDVVVYFLTIITFVLTFLGIRKRSSS